MEEEGRQVSLQDDIRKLLELPSSPLPSQPDPLKLEIVKVVPSRERKDLKEILECLERGRGVLWRVDRQRYRAEDWGRPPEVFLTELLVEKQIQFVMAIESPVWVVDGGMVVEIVSGSGYPPVIGDPDSPRDIHRLNACIVTADEGVRDFGREWMWKAEKERRLT